MGNKFIYEIDGQKGQILKLYEDRCVILTKGSLKTLFSKNKTANEKIYLFKHVTDIRMNNKSSAGVITFDYKDPDQNPIYEFNNTFEFGAGFTTPMYGVVTSQMDHVYEDIIKYWKATAPSVAEPERVVDSQNTVSVADELLKFKQLLDMGVITKEEFEQQKDKLLHS